MAELIRSLEDLAGDVPPSEEDVLDTLETIERLVERTRNVAVNGRVGEIAARAALLRIAAYAVSAAAAIDPAASANRRRRVPAEEDESEGD